MEIFKTINIEGFDNYQISNFGRLKDIKLKLTDNEDDNLSIASGVGIMPFVLYNFKLNGDTSQYAIKEKVITFLRLYHNEIVPEMEMIFVDSNNIFKDNTPTDDKKIRVFLRINLLIIIISNC